MADVEEHDTPNPGHPFGFRGEGFPSGKVGAYMITNVWSVGDRVRGLRFGA